MDCHGGWVGCTRPGSNGYFPGEPEGGPWEMSGRITEGANQPNSKGRNRNYWPQKESMSPTGVQLVLTARRPLCPGRASKCVRVAGWWDPAEKRSFARYHDRRDANFSRNRSPFSRERCTVKATTTSDALLIYRYRLTQVPDHSSNQTSKPTAAYQ